MRQQPPLSCRYSQILVVTSSEGVNLVRRPGKALTFSICRVLVDDLQVFAQHMEALRDVRIVKLLESSRNMALAVVASTSMAVPYQEYRQSSLTLNGSYWELYLELKLLPSAYWGVCSRAAKVHFTP